MNQKIDIFSFVALPSWNTKKNHPKWDLGKDFSSQAFIERYKFKIRAFPKTSRKRFWNGRVIDWRLYVTSMLVFQGGKTFCASFCASLIACVCLSRLVLWEFWLRLNEIHEVRTFAPCKGFFCFCCCCCFFFTWKLLWIQNNQCYSKNRSSVSLRRNKTLWTFPKRFVFFW